MGPAYAWEQVWEHQGWLEILGRYLVGQEDKKKQIQKIIFPRYHQLDATKKLQAAVLADGGEVTMDDVLAAQMAGRAQDVGITFVAFTATPKTKTMELFGTRPDARVVPAGTREESSPHSPPI